MENAKKRRAKNRAEKSLPGLLFLLFVAAGAVRVAFVVFGAVAVVAASAVFAAVAFFAVFAALAVVAALTVFAFAVRIVTFAHLFSPIISNIPLAGM